MSKFMSFSKVPQKAREFGFFVGGNWYASEGRDLLSRKAPGYGLEVSRITLCNTEDVNKAVAAARATFNNGYWASISGADRGKVLTLTAQGIRDRIEELAFWETLETGKPISQSRSEIADAATHYEYCAGLAQTLHGETFNNYGDSLFGMVIREPIGVVGLITPWNFPFIVLSERLPYILASGNSIVVKPSELTSVTTLLLADILKKSGLPDGAYNVVTGYGNQVGQAISEHPGIDAISFTGSTQTGEAVMKAAATNFKKVNLELGGKNPQIVFADADLEDAADGVAFGMCFNAGQCCVSGSRLIVESSVKDQFLDLLVHKLNRLIVGDCFDANSQMGAIVSAEHCSKIHRYVNLGIEEGGNVLIGGKNMKINEGGCFYSPTIILGIQNDMRVGREEIFGPVLSVMTFENEQKAISLANDSDYGLSLSVWSKNIDKAMGMIRKVNGGRTWVNTTIAGGPGQPLGGYKQSGIGRDAGLYGVEEYTEIKSIHVALGKRMSWIK